MGRIRWPQMTLLGRIALLLAAFGAAMALQIGIGYYQTKYVLEPLEKRSESIRNISRFLNDVEACMAALENYRWDYGDTISLIKTVQVSRQRSAACLENIEADLRAVSEEQYLLASAAQTTYRMLYRTLDSIVSKLEASQSAQASELYYSTAEPCGAYLRQYIQQLLERACFDSQDAHIRMTAFDRYLPKHLLTALDILGDVAVLALGVIMLVVGWQYATTLGSRGFYVSLPKLSRFWMYFPVPLAGVTMIVFELESLYNHIKSLFVPEGKEGQA